MIAVEVTGISVSPPFQGYVVILKEKEGQQWLPIFIGAAEAHTISLLLQGMKYVRPLTYDMFNSIIEASSATVKKVEVTELKENTFYALIYLQTSKGEKRIDARPSDAIALALKTDSPVYVAPEIFKEAGMQGDIAQAEPISAEDRLEELEKKLKDAVESEEYEEAAKLRDRIRDLSEDPEAGESPAQRNEEN
ncbi:bifunctional nuclease family protein [bacterium]|nr:bifunctional nuclease family protein [bacterium]